jgi:predicted permease
MTLPVPILLLLTSLSATLEVLVMVGVGMYLYYKKYIVESHVRTLTVIVFSIFTPCMVGYKFSSGVDWEMIKRTYWLIVFSVMYVIAANILARTLFLRGIWKDKVKGVKQTVLQLSVTFNNAGSLPYVFVSALTNTGTLFPDRAMADKAIAYISLYLLPVQLLFWSYGMVVLRKDEDEDDSDKKQLVDSNGQEERNETLEDIEESAMESEDPTVPLSENEIQVEEVLDEQLNPSDSNTTTAPSMKTKIVNALKRMRKKLPPFSKVVTPPIYGCLIGAFIALVPHLKEFFITNPPVIVSSISHIAKIFGDAVFPLSMILLGANLANTMMAEAEGKVAESPDHDDNDKQSKVKKSWFRKIIKHNDPLAVLVAVVTRLIFMPLIGIGLVVLFIYLGLLPRNDPVLLLVLLVEASTPTAINVSLLCTLNGNNGIHEICELLLIMYVTSPITMSLFATGYLYLSCYFAQGKCSL